MRLQALIGSVAALAFWPGASAAPDSPAAILGEAPSCHVGAAPPAERWRNGRSSPGLLRLGGRPSE